MKKGLFIMIGECFREGMSTSRLKDTEYGVKNQTESSISHHKLFKKLTNINYHIDVAIHTYETKYKDLLLTFYENIIYTNFSTFYYSDEFRQIVIWSINNVLSVINMDEYDFIFICRLDLLLKEKLIENFNPEWTEITYPSVQHVENNIAPVISDVFCFIPKKYFHPYDNWKGLLNSQILHHHSVLWLIDNGLKLKDINFVTYYIYISNTFDSSNPFYAINCRQEHYCTRNIDINKKYDRNLNKVIDEN